MWERLKHQWHEWNEISSAAFSLSPQAEFLPAPPRSPIRVSAGHSSPAVHPPSLSFLVHCQKERPYNRQGHGGIERGLKRFDIFNKIAERF